MADITEISSRSNVSVRIADIGRMGCYADSLNVFPIGTHVQLRIRHAGEICQIGATVIYALSGMGMGLNFAPLAPNMEAILTRWSSPRPRANRPRQTQIRITNRP